MSGQNKNDVKLLVDQFCTITGIGRSEAKVLLEACNNNLEVALNMHMEGVAPDAATAASSSAYPNEDNVRAPIPQKRETLVEPPDEYSYSFRGRRRAAKSVFDKFRDFEAETKRQEEEMLQSIDQEASSSNPGHSSTKRQDKKMKKKTLEDLFRPPIDLMFKGNFHSARDRGVADKKWLLVNVQDASEFPCQVLNRDVWSNSAVRTIIQEHFIFWQIYHDSEEGASYMMFYKINSWPYVAIIDPRTGECLATWSKLDAVTFCDLIVEFLASHTDLNDSVSDDSSSPVKKKSRVESEVSILEADEAAQIEAAIQASLKESERTNPEECANENNDNASDGANSDTLETFDSESEDVDYSIKKSDLDSNDTSQPSKSSRTKFVNGTNKPTNIVHENGLSSKSQIQDDDLLGTDDEPWKKHLGKESDPKSELMLRLPDGSKELVTFPSTSRLMALVLFVAKKGYSNESYEMVTNFPRKKLSYLDFNITLKEAGLFPKESIFVQSR